MQTALQAGTMEAGYSSQGMTQQARKSPREPVTKACTFGGKTPMPYTAGTDLPGLDHLFKYIKIIKATNTAKAIPAISFWKLSDSFFIAIRLFVLSMVLFVQASTSSVYME